MGLSSSVKLKWIIIAIMYWSTEFCSCVIDLRNECETEDCKESDLQKLVKKIKVDETDLKICPDVEVIPGKPKESYEFHKVPDRVIYAFSAFYDDRTLAGGPLVRVLVNGLQVRFHKDIIPLYCLLVFEGLDHPISVLATYKFIYPSNLIPDENTAHWIECPVPLDSVPVSVTVLPSECAPEPTFWLPVHVREAGEGEEKYRKQRIALCTPALYNARDWVQLAEWIILHKLLGYSTVYFYVMPGGRQVDEANRILDMYSQQWDPDIKVVVVPWNIGLYWDVFYFNQHVAINDCLYRAGLDHDYVTVADKDEVLMPMNHASLPSFLAEFESDTTAAYMFQHVMFDDAMKEPLTQESILSITGLDIQDININIEEFQPWTLTQKWHMEHPYPAKKVRSKTIYNVHRTISADVHFPKDLVASYSAYLVEPADGVVYHYKPDPPDVWRKAVRYIHGSKVEDYQDQLLKDLLQLMTKLRKEN